MQVQYHPRLADPRVAPPFSLRFFLAVFLSLIAHFSFAAESCKSLIATGNPEYPPYLWRDPDDATHLIGANADFMELLEKELGIPVETRYVGTWARVQEEVKLGRADLVAGAFLTLPRLEYMDYFHPAFHETKSVIWIRSDSTLRYKKWADLTGKRGLTVINNSFGEEFDRYARESLKISSVPSIEQALKMLNLSRADYLIYEEDPGLAYATKINNSSIKTIKPAVSNEGLHVTLSHKSPCNTAEIRGRIAKALYKLTRHDVMSKLIENNIELWRRQTR
jgi:polar amino acid transport system substrate-binding protein